MSSFKTVDEKVLRGRLSKEIEAASFEDVRNAYMNAFGPIDIYINEEGRIAFDEKGLKWEQYQHGKRAGWVAMAGGLPVYRTDDIRTPGAHERYEALERARQMELIEEEPRAKQDDLPAKNKGEAEGPYPSFFHNPSGNDAVLWNPRDELQEYVKRCSPDQLVTMARKLLGVSYCKRQGKEFLVVEGRPKDGIQRHDRASLREEMSRALSRANEEEFARLSSEVLGRECVSMGNWEFLVHEKALGQAMAIHMQEPER
jgi:hypothetical protein